MKIRTIILIFPLLILMFVSTYLLSSGLTPSPENSMYLFKAQREKLQGVLIFGNYDKATWKLTLAEKRISEARVLIEKQNYRDGLQRLNTATENIDLAVQHCKLARENGEDINYIQIKVMDATSKIKGLVQQINQSNQNLEVKNIIDSTQNLSCE